MSAPAPRLAIVLSHPTQYYSPWFRWLRGRAGLEFRVFYLWDFGLTTQRDPQFGTEIKWDTDLTSGYDWELVPNRSRDPGTHHFGGLDNPGLAGRLSSYQPGALLLFGYKWRPHLRAIWWARSRGIPLLFRGDSHLLGRGTPAWFRRLLLRFLYRQFSAVTYVGQANREYFRALGVAPDRLFFAPHSVDAAHFDPANAAARDLAEARDTAQTANQAKSAFLANISHELRTPLNAIIGYADVLRQDLGEQGQKQLADDARWIDSSARHLLGMINELLDMAKIESGRVELDVHAFNVADVVEEVRTTLEPLAQANGNTLEIRVASDIGEARTDSTKLRQCLVNLGGNACKFTRGGHVIVTAHAITIARRDWIEFAVSDSGIGMTHEQVARLFEPFQQADASTTRKYGGTVLGLAITARLVEMLQARLSIDSMPGVGSTFRLRMPRRLSESEIAAAKRSINPQPNPAKVAA